VDGRIIKNIIGQTLSYYAAFLIGCGHNFAACWLYIPT